MFDDRCWVINVGCPRPDDWYGVLVSQSCRSEQQAFIHFAQVFNLIFPENQKNYFFIVV